MGEKFLHTIGKPLVWMQWRALESLLKWQYGLKKVNMVPAHRIEDQISCSLGVEPVGFYDRIHKGSIRAVQAIIHDFTDEGVLLEEGTKLKADVVVFGTGFRQNIDFVEKEYRDHLLDANGAFNLYRNIIHPDVPNLAFIGFNSSLFTTLTSEIAAHWVVRHALGDIALPSRASMLEEIKKEKHWRKHGRPIASEFSGTCVAPFNYHHLDDLMRDMKKRTRASSNFLYESMKPIDPKDYKKILG